MAHGFSLTRHDGLLDYARVFSAAGADVLVFDHRFLGDSGGQPRQRVRLREQRADWRAAVAQARGLGAEKVVLWGFSMSGAHVVQTAMADPGIAAVLAHAPFINGLQRALAAPLSANAKILVRAIPAALGSNVTIPVTAPPGDLGAMALAGEAAGFAAVVPAGFSVAQRGVARALPVGADPPALPAYQATELPSLVRTRWTRHHRARPVDRPCRLPGALRRTPALPRARPLDAVRRRRRNPDRPRSGRLLAAQRPAVGHFLSWAHNSSMEGDRRGRGAPGTSRRTSRPPLQRVARPVRRAPHDRLPLPGPPAQPGSVPPGLRAKSAYVYADSAWMGVT